MAVLLHFDELSPNGNSVAYLLDSHFLSSTNNKTVAQKVVQTANDYGIDYDSVLVFNSDNVAYMKKAFTEALSCMFPNCVHVTCLSHIANLVASDFKKKFKDVTEFVKCFRNLFFVSGGQKSSFRNFLQDAIGRRPLKFPHHLAFSRTISLFSALFSALFGKIFRTIFHFFPHSTRSPVITNN